MSKKSVLLIITLALVILIAIIPFTSACSPAATSTSSTATTSSSSAVKVIKGQSLFPDSDYGYITFNKVILSKINERLADKGIQLELKGPDTLVPSGEMFSALKMGSLAFAFTDFGFDSQSLPELIVGIEMPFSWQSYDQNMTFFEKYGALQFFRESYASANIHLSAPISGPPNVLMLKKEIKTVGDLQGLKIWCGPPDDIFIADIGAAPVSIPPPEVYMGLQLGTLDGCTYSEPELETMNFAQVVKYVYHPAVNTCMNLPFNFNMDIWNSFSPEVQNIIDSTAKEFNKEYNTQYNIGAQQGLAYFKAHGGTVIDLSPEVVAQFTQTARASWDKIVQVSNSDRAVQAVKMLRDFMKAENIP
jgi:TRAP-type C4-dicarboxylate transport system substrate-binding protein